MNEINERVKSVRLDVGLAPAVYAEKLEEKVSKIKDIERGKQKPTAEFLTKVVDVFHVDGTWLLTGKGKMRGNMVREDVAGYGQSPEDRLRYVTEVVLTIATERKVKPDPMQLGPLRDFAYIANLSDQHIHAIFDLLEDAPKVYGYKQFNNGE